MNKPKSIKCVCVLWVNGLRYENHFFDLPVFGEPGFYQHTTSYTGFRNRQNTAFAKRLKSKRWLPHMEIRGAMHPIDEMFLGSEREKNDHRLNVPCFNHDTIFDVYLAIGYDYKKRRFLTESERSETGRLRQRIVVEPPKKSKTEMEQTNDSVDGRRASEERRVEAGALDEPESSGQKINREIGISSS